LSAIRFDANERIVIPFTTMMQRVTLHYLDTTAYRGFQRCAGDECLLCGIGRAKEERDLLPVYDAVAKQVAVMPISPNIRPHALRPQLMPILRRLKEQDGSALAARTVLVIRKPDTTRFEISTSVLPPDAEDGSSQIAAFLEQLQEGTIRLDNVFPLLPAEELTAIPEVAESMRLKGIAL
jgi:hypothetical protein